MNRSPLLDRYCGCLRGATLGSLLASLLAAPPLPQKTSPSLEKLLLSSPYPPTNDTLLLLDLVRSYLTRRGLDLDDVAARMLSWFQQLAHPPGNQTWAALLYLEQGTPPATAGRMAWEQSGRQAAGHGPLKYCFLPALARLEQRSLLEEETRSLCQLTHYDPRCVDASLAANRLLGALLRQEWRSPADTLRHLIGLHPSLGEAMQTAPLLPLHSLETSGYVLTTLQCAYRLMMAPSAGDAFEQLLQLPTPSSTLATLAGALIGARFGDLLLPPPLQQALDPTIPLSALAEQLLDLSTTSPH